MVIAACLGALRPEEYIVGKLVLQIVQSDAPRCYLRAIAGYSGNLREQDGVVTHVFLLQGPQRFKPMVCGQTLDRLQNLFDVRLCIVGMRHNSVGLGLKPSYGE